MSWTQRSAGVLLHISSLPSRQLGADALRFMDVMAQAGLRVWQILPVGPATKHHNPFEPASTFAGDPALVPLGAGDGADEDSFEAFQREHADWLPDWALFSALEHELGDLPWWEWPPPLRDREPPALETARERLATHIKHACLAQFAFERAWSGLRAQAHARGIRIFGDVPLFVSHDSAEVWTHRELFEVDPTGQCAAVVGVPPDAFSETGQFWGYPPYRWEVMAQTGFAWWKRRFKIQARRFDLVRLDHFRGFAA
jgi:4-alpha-glucanotransferase